MKTRERLFAWLWLPALTGHKSIQELERYIAARDQQTLAGAAVKMFEAEWTKRNPRKD